MNFQMLSNDLNESFIRLIYCCRTVNDVILIDSMKQWKQQWNFSILFCIGEYEQVKVKIWQRSY